MNMSNSECLSWDNRNVGTKEIPTDIPNGQTPVRGVVTRKKKVIFDEVFLVKNEDLEKEELYIEERKFGEPFVYETIKESFYRIVGVRFTKDKDKDYRWWGHCMFEYSKYSIERNKWERFTMVF